MAKREITYEEKKDFLEHIWTCAHIFGEGDSSYDSFKDSVKIYYADIDGIPMDEFTNLMNEIKSLIISNTQMDQFGTMYYAKINDIDYVNDKLALLTA